MPAPENVEAQYQGTSQIAEGSAGTLGPAVTIPEPTATLDASQRIRYYQFLENQDKWARSNLVADKYAEQAAQMNQFKLENYAIPEDTNAVYGALGDFTSYFAQHAGDAHLRFDSNNNVINGKEYATLMQKRNYVDYLIGRASARTSKYNTMHDAYEKETNPYKKASMGVWNDAQAKLPINQDLTTYPDLATADPAWLTPTTINVQSAVQQGDKLVTTKWGFPDIPQSIAKQQLAFGQIGTNVLPNDAESKLMLLQEFVNKQQTQWQGIYNTIHNQHNDWDTDKIMNSMQGQGGGADQFYHFWSDYQNKKGFYLNAIAKNPELKNAAPPPDVDPSNLTQSDVLALLFNNNAAQPSVAVTADYFPGDINRINAATEKARLAFEQRKFDLTDNPATMGNGIAEAISTIGTWNGDPATNALDLSGDVAKQGKDPKQYTNYYQLPVSSPMVQNIFRKQMPPTTYFDTDKGTTVTQQKSAEITSAFRVASADGDANKNLYIVHYNIPSADGKTIEGHSTEVYDNNFFKGQATHVYDPGNATADQMGNAKKGISGWLTANKLPEGATVSQIIDAYNKTQSTSQLGGKQVNSQTNTQTTKTTIPAGTSYTYNGPTVGALTSGQSYSIEQLRALGITDQSVNTGKTVGNFTQK